MYCISGHSCRQHSLHLPPPGKKSRHVSKAAKTRNTRDHARRQSQQEETGHSNIEDQGISQCEPERYIAQMDGYGEIILQYGRSHEAAKADVTKRLSQLVLLISHGLNTYLNPSAPNLMGLEPKNLWDEYKFCRTEVSLIFY